MLIVKYSVKTISGTTRIFKTSAVSFQLNGTVKSTHANSPGVGIIQIANQLDAEFIVTGSRGHSTIRRTFLGSVSDYILHHSNVPVLIVTYPKDNNKDKEPAVNHKDHGVTKENHEDCIIKHKEKHKGKH